MQHKHIKSNNNKKTSFDCSSGMVCLCHSFAFVIAKHIFRRKMYSYIMVATCIFTTTICIEYSSVSTQAPTTPDHLSNIIDFFSSIFISFFGTMAAASIANRKRIQHDEVNLFFDLQTGIKGAESVCKLCKKTLTGQLHYNNSRHLTSVHKIVVAPKANKTAPHEQSEKLVKVSLRIDPEKIRKGYVELVTINGRPYSAVEDNGLKKITEPIVDALEKSGFHFTMNRTKIIDDISAYALKVKNYIKMEVKSKPISVMLDIATRYNLSVLGVSVQFVDDDVVQVRHLGMVKLETSHSGAYVCSKLLEILDEFDIEKKFVFSVTNDNGTNVIKSAEILEFFKNEIDLALIQKAMESSSLNENDGDDEFEWTNDCNNDQIALNQYETVMKEAAEQLGVTISENRAYLTENLLRILLCGSHTLELAIKDAVNGSPIELGLLYGCREMMKLLRTPKYVNMLNLWIQNHPDVGEKLLRPVIDNETRWGSKFKMVRKYFENILKIFGFGKKKSVFYAQVNRALALKDVCIEWNIPAEAAVRFSEAEWDCLKKFQTSLEIANIATIKLQRESLLLSDFFAVWTEMKLSLGKIQDYDFANKLLAEIKSREENILDELVFAAVYLDRRYNVLLTSAEAKIAEDFLVELWQWLNKLKESVVTNDEENNNFVSVTVVPVQEQQAKSVLEEYMESIHPEVQEMIENSDIRSKVQLFRAQPLLRMNTDILKFWEDNKRLHPELYEMSLVLNGVPATEVQIERDFSAFAFIYNERRTSMNPTNLNNTMLIRLNANIFQKV